MVSLMRRVSPVEIRSLASLYRYLAPGELLNKVPEHVVFREYWAEARSPSWLCLVMMLITPATASEP